MKTKFLTYFFGLMAMVLAACTSDEVEMTMQDAQTFVYAMDLDGGKFDFDATRAAKSWESGDKIHIRFGKGNKGTATYNGSTWSLTTDQALEGSGSCTAVEIDGTVAENGSTVTMSGLNPVYQCNSGSFSLSGNVIKVSIKLTPATGRLRFKGTSGTSVNLEGMTTYSAYNTTTGEFTSTTAAVSTTIQSDGYTPYIYGTLTNTSEPTLKTNGYVMKCPTTMLQVGKSGWLTYPTDSKHTGWTKEESGGLTVSGSENGHYYVDLGLSVKWATCNVGANAPQDYGWYLAWGETKPKDKYTSVNYYFYADLSNIKYTKEGATLAPEDDAAHVNWGGSWRMPTKAECDELKTSTNLKWTTMNGVKGFTLTSRINGNSIFLPAAGYREDNRSESGKAHYVGIFCSYWSNTLTEEFDMASILEYCIDDNYVLFGEEFRSKGLSVRPVCPQTATR